MVGALVSPSRPCRVCSAPVFPEQRFCGECGAGVGLEAFVDEAESEGGVADPLVGRVVADRYRMIRCIGRGGMGVVYEVEHVHIGKRLAMKLLHGELAGDQATIRRLRREAEAASRLSDSSTVQVFDFGTSDGLAYLVMELVDGDDLGQLLRLEGSVPFERIARLLLDVCGSLAEAHALGIVHRDLKPENVMVMRGSIGERAKVLDFGLAMLRASAHQSVSRTGTIVGTPHYMSPEQIRADEVDARTDVYALGGVLYRAVTGAPPFTGDSAIVVLTKHLNEPVVPPRELVPALDPQAEAIILRCLAKSPRDRYGDVDALAQDLEAWLDGRGLLEGNARRDVTSANRVDALATRRDVDAYESRMRRRGRATTLILAALALGLAIAIGTWVIHGVVDPGPRTQESEPNHTPALATPIERAHPVSGRVARRLDTERGDIDVYRLVRPEGEGRTAIAAELTGLPNMDLMLELFREGSEDPLLRVDGSGVGGGESFVGFPIDAGAYLLVVRERWVSGRYPTENVSDRYSVRWDVVPGDDGEIDDTIPTARALGPGRALRGRIGWPGDVDVVCVPEGVRGRITVTPGPGVDIVLAVAGDPGTASIDEAREGDPETRAVDGTAAGRCLRIFESTRADAPPVPSDASMPRDAPYGVFFAASP